MTKLWRIPLYWYPGSNFTLFQSTFFCSLQHAIAPNVQNASVSQCAVNIQNKKLFHILWSTEMTAEYAKDWLALHCSWWVGAGAVLHTKLYHLQSHGGLIICRLHTWAGMSGAQFAELTQACKFAYIPILSEAVQIYMYIRMCTCIQMAFFMASSFFPEEPVFSK